MTLSEKAVYLKGIRDALNLDPEKGENKLISGTVDLLVDQEFTIDGRNTITVQDGKIAVTWADCPDHYCMKRGYCSGGTDIVCLPNRLVIEFLGDQEVDAAIG